MQLNCPINQAEAIRRGFDTSSTVKLEIDPALLTQDQRDLLAIKFKDGAYEAYGDDRLPTPTHDGLVESLEKQILKSKANAEQAEKRKQDLLARFDANPRSVFYYTAYLDSASFYDGFQSTWLDDTRRDRFELALAEVKAEHQEQQAAKESEEALRLANRQAIETERDAKKETFRQWAITHGSETLRLRAEEGFIWPALAAEEWATAMLAQAGITDTPLTDPEGYTPDCDSLGEPTAEEIKNLRRFRQALATVPELETTVELKIATYTEESDGDHYQPEEPVIITRHEIHVKITTPHGTETRWFQA
jgi:hypothetical protein